MGGCFAFPLIFGGAGGAGGGAGTFGGSSAWLVAAGASAAMRATARA